MKKIVIAGGTGFLGMNLADHLSNLGFKILLISRNAPKSNTIHEHVKWDGRTLGDWVNQLENSFALVNLVGRTVDCIKTPDHCDEILRSRVEATLVLGKALKAIKSFPKVWVQMSTAHIYGDPPNLICTEDSSYGYGLAPTVAKAWEKAYFDSTIPGIRQVVLRTSFVLGKGKGALTRLEKITKLGLGGTVGSGQQGISWIHEADMNRLFEAAITNTSMSGIYIASAPNPVSNKTFMQEMRKAMGIPVGLPATKWMAQIGARYFMRTDPELALYGRYCKSLRLMEEGFEFRFPEIRGAFGEIYK